MLIPMKFRWRNIRHDIDRKADRAYLWLAVRLPRRLRMWVVVDSTNSARELHPDPTGYAGPDGLGYKHIYEGALRVRRA